MKYFVLSDIHSHYEALINALNNAGFDETNPKHKCIIVGDLFDRGEDAHAVLTYVMKLEESNKAHVLLGNHDDFLLEFLAGDDTKTAFNIMHNGFGETLESLSQMRLSTQPYERIRKSIHARYPGLLAWLKARPLFCEIDDYIFVHGGIDGSNPKWRKTSSKHDFLWNRQHLLPHVPGKTVVVGHTRIPTIRTQTLDYRTLHQKHPEQFDILHGDGFIMIDRFVEISKELNVLILDLEGPIKCT